MKKIIKSAYKMKTVMIKAWALAREGSARFGGSARQYMGAALREAWKSIKGDKWIDITSELLADLKNASPTSRYDRYGRDCSMEGAAHWIGR